MQHGAYRDGGRQRENPTAIALTRAGLVHCTSAEPPWLASAKNLCPEVGEQVTALMHTPAHGPRLAPVIDAARLAAATRAMTQLRVTHGDLAFAGSRAVVARAVFERYGCGPSDAARVQARLREPAAAQHKGLVGW